MKKNTVKYYFNFTIPYCPNKYIQLALCKITFTTGYRVQFTIFNNNACWWKHFILYEKHKKEKILSIDELFEEWSD